MILSDGVQKMKHITVDALYKKMVDDTSTKVVDVRTKAENRAIHFEGAENIPVEDIAKHVEELKKYPEVYISCHSGGRSTMVCEDLKLHGLDNLVNVDGGIQAWISEGLPVIRTKRWCMPMMQQVLAIAGSLVLLGVLGSKFINPNFIWLSLGVGCGLTFAGLSGKCYMTKVLEKMPWNK